jgi:hypothetical protein
MSSSTFSSKRKTSGLSLKQPHDLEERNNEDYKIKLLYPQSKPIRAGMTLNKGLHGQLAKSSVQSHEKEGNTAIKTRKPFENQKISIKRTINTSDPESTASYKPSETNRWENKENLPSAMNKVERNSLDTLSKTAHEMDENVPPKVKSLSVDLNLHKVVERPLMSFKEVSRPGTTNKGFEDHRIDKEQTTTSTCKVV